MKIKSFLIIIFTLMIFPKTAFAIVKQNANCDNRYLTIVNPVRGRDLWKDKTLKPLVDQYNLIKQHNFAATWLLQYDTLNDKELISQIKSFDQKQEPGVFLEVSKKLAKKSQVVYPQNSLWYEPKAVFLSGYTQSDRKRLIDRMFADFKSQFGTYPKSVGAWWIDSYSLDYMRQKYGIKSAMIVADQLTTDQYGVWGQWWGVPYYPSKSNILAPAGNLDNKQNAVVIQWAQRHPVLAHGSDSSYSLQANDYIKLGKDINFFDQLVQVYLSCDNKIGQITIGLETGMESVDFIDEYNNQLDHLAKIDNLSGVTMEQFSDRFKTIYPGIANHSSIKYGDSVFDMNPKTRSNPLFKELIYYNPELSFADYFLPDSTSFLDRNLSNKQFQIINRSHEKWLLFIIILSLPLIFRRQFKLWVSSLLFAYACFGLILKSGYKLGWMVFYGAKIENLLYVQIGTVLSVYIIFRLLNGQKKLNNFIWFLPLSFAVEPLIQFSRMSFLSGKYYFGFIFNRVNFAGLTFGKPFNFSFFKIEFDPLQAQSLLKADFNRIWDNLWLFFIIYPFIHVFAAFVFRLIYMRVPVIVKKMFILILLILFIFHLSGIYSADPRYITFSKQ